MATRAKANPDPAVLEETRDAPHAGKYVITAYRTGAWSVELGGAVIASRASQLGAYYGASRFPSNRMQDKAIADARVAIESYRNRAP